MNLAATTGAQDIQTLKGFVRAHDTQSTDEALDAVLPGVLAYVRDVILPGRVRRAPKPRERVALLDLADRLETLADQDESMGTLRNESLQGVVYQVGKDHGFDPLRSWFRALYEVLLGSSDGPRFGHFIALYGCKRSAVLLRKGADGTLGDTPPAPNSDPNSDEGTQGPDARRSGTG